mmetsp:Transcript_48068/g.114238  ORF Transcript_48068/g.114238 Transcript_48068/m.114238 type:complete len:227 (+) Transcript_48068:1115-1795(+)
MRIPKVRGQVQAQGHCEPHHNHDEPEALIWDGAFAPTWMFHQLVAAACNGKRGDYSRDFALQREIAIHSEVRQSWHPHAQHINGPVPQVPRVGDLSDPNARTVAKNRSGCHSQAVTFSISSSCWIFFAFLRLEDAVCQKNKHCPKAGKQSKVARIRGGISEGHERRCNHTQTKHLQRAGYTSGTNRTELRTKMRAQHRGQSTRQHLPGPSRKHIKAEICIHRCRPY